MADCNLAARTLCALCICGAWLVPVRGEDPAMVTLTDEVGQRTSLRTVRVQYDLGPAWPSFPMGIPDGILSPYHVPLCSECGVVWVVPLDRITHVEHRDAGAAITFRKGDQLQGNMPRSYAIIGSNAGADKEYPFDSLRAIDIDAEAMTRFCLATGEMPAVGDWPGNYPEGAMIGLTNGATLTVRRIAFLEQGTVAGSQGLSSETGAHWRISRTVTIDCTVQSSQPVVGVIDIRDIYNLQYSCAEVDAAGIRKVELRTRSKVVWRGGKIIATDYGDESNQKRLWETVALIGEVPSGLVLVPLAAVGGFNVGNIGEKDLIGMPGNPRCADRQTAGGAGHDPSLGARSSGASIDTAQSGTSTPRLSQSRQGEDGQREPPLREQTPGANCAGSSMLAWMTVFTLLAGVIAWAVLKRVHQ